MEPDKLEKGLFMVTLQAIIYNPKTKKILIGKRENDPHIPKLSWCFIGGLAHHDELEESIKKIIKEKVGLDVEIGKIIHAKTYPEHRKIISIYFTTTYHSGELELKSTDFVELKWIKPTEIKKYFTTSVHPEVYRFMESLEK